MVAVQSETMSLDEFIQRYEQSRFEFIDGEIISIMPPAALHVLIVDLMRDLIKDYIRVQKTGRAFSEAPYIVSDKANWVQGSKSPDVMFYRGNRFAEYQAVTADWQDKPFILVPDLVIEVLSKNDTYSEIDAKVSSYLADGVSLIWVIDPRRKVVIIHAPNRASMRLGEDQTLSGGDILPDFEISIQTIFEPNR